MTAACPLTALTGAGSILFVSSGRGQAFTNRGFLDSLVASTSSFCRSLFLLQLLAGFHFLLRALPLRRHAPRVNRGVVSARHGLVGAPLFLYLAVALPFAAAVPPSAMGHASTASAASKIDSLPDSSPSGAAASSFVPGPILLGQSEVPGLARRSPDSHCSRDAVRLAGRFRLPSSVSSEILIMFLCILP